MSKNLTLGFIILCSLDFYQFAFLGNSTKVLKLLAVGLIIGMYILYSIYDTSPRIRKNFSLYIGIILFALPGSMYIAYYYHDQSLGITSYEQRGMYFYLLYFLLPLMKPKPENVERLFFMFGVLYMLLYIFQYLLYPTIIFESKVVEDRGTLRMVIPGSTYLMLTYFYSLQAILKQEKWYYVLYCLFVMAILVMQGGRQLILFTTLMTVGILLFNPKVKSKILLFILIIMVFIPVVFMFQEVFNEIIDVNKKEQSQGIENIRIRAALFYFKTLFPNDISYILGNGIPNNRSSYGHMLSIYSTLYGFYLSDIGIFGNYVSYGLFFVLGVLTLLWKILKTKVQEYYRYIKYFFIMILGLIFMGNGFQESEFIVPLCLCLYLFDVSIMNKKIEENQNEDIEDATSSQNLKAPYQVYQ